MFKPCVNNALKVFTVSLSIIPPPQKKMKKEVWILFMPELHNSREKTAWLKSVGAPRQTIVKGCELLLQHFTTMNDVDTLFPHISCELAERLSSLFWLPFCGTEAQWSNGPVFSAVSSLWGIKTGGALELPAHAMVWALSRHSVRR